ncbi:oxidoreductase [Acuticoccus sp. MNP-M23]|uniref:molybdopterin-dependent oxidoreductase n=1 Tax=Acuticoccus sp. MNP-M23 TaxID=3072793 RepID=UPI0028153F63|nr:molybdopterin-dependent oxidoreductase [Acuticoccus sp. MNP-M23]WMS42075.1 oxidoreductase [Acuticoccus sp. MNP-M23]
MFFLNRLASFALAITLCLGAPLALADQLAAPTGEPLLTVRGDIGNTNEDGTAVFDRAMLEAMPATTITTKTIWTEGEQTFVGVSLKALMDAVAADGSTLRAIALNDYAVEIPMAEAMSGAPVLAYRLNGETMSVRNKGPLWIIYPYDSDPEYRSEVVYSRSIWQLSALEVE